MEPNDVVRAALEQAVQAVEHDMSIADRLCATCVAVLPIDGAALSIAHGRSTHGTLGSSSELSRLLDELQFTFGEGPCLDSVRDGNPVLVADLQDPRETRWPAYSNAVLDLGVRAVYALPVATPSAQVGVLDLYRRDPGTLDGLDLAGGLLAAELAAMPLLDLLNADVDWAAAGEGRGDWPAPSSLERVEVYQATGMIMGQLGVGAGEALIRLRAYAFAQGMTATEVAWSIVERRLRLESDDSWLRPAPREGGRP